MRFVPSSIAYLVSQYPAVNHTFILREIRGLRKLGFDIRVASVRTPDRSAELMTDEEREEMRATFYIKPAGVMGALRGMFRNPLGALRSLAYALRLTRGHRNILYWAEALVFTDWMRREQLDRVHMHFSSTVGLLAARIAPMRTSVTIHGPDEFNDPVGFYLSEKIHDFDLLCAISNYGRSQLMRLSEYTHWNKFRVSRLGVDPRVYAPGPFRETPAQFEIISVGRLAPAKAQHVLVAAIDRLARAGRKVRLRFVGDGPDRAGLERDVAERGLGAHVFFEGRQNADRVLELYRESDIFALPSFAEGIPVVLMEAMAMEIPCVTTWITGIPELIRDGVDGLLVPPSSDEELAEALARLMDDAPLRRSIGQAARLRVMEHYDLNRNTAALAEILQQL